MKKNLFIILLFSWYSLYSQHPDLIQRWYVQSININGNTNEIPNDNTTFPFAYLYFFGNDGNSISANHFIDGCEIGFNGSVTFNSNSQFNFSVFNLINSSTNCTSILIDFMSAYVDFFNTTLQYNFNYTITVEANNSKTLIITNSNNDYVTLTNKFLTLPPFELTSTNRWYLHKLIINGIEYPSNSPSLSFWIDFDYIIDEPTQLYHNVCYDFFSGIQNFDISNNSFYYYHLYEGLSSCFSDYDNLIHDMNIALYSQQVPGPFHYSVSGSQELQLVITAPNGDQAIYGNNPLSVNDYLDHSFMIFPNPVSDFLYIDNINNIEFQKISISNTIGQILQTTNQDYIDFSNFKQGIYNITIETNRGNLNKLIVKE
jgi:hypothetical protein